TRVGAVEQVDEEVRVFVIEGRVVGLQVPRELSEDQPAPPDRDDPFVSGVDEVVPQHAGVEDVRISENDLRWARDLRGSVGHSTSPASFWSRASSARIGALRSRSAARNAWIETTVIRWWVPTLRESS